MISTWQPVSDRISSARFSSKLRNINIIQFYIPTELAEDNEKDECYSRLSAVYVSTPRGNIEIVMGDPNAKVYLYNSDVEDVMDSNGVHVRNDIGDRFVDFCRTQHLVIDATIFQYRTRGKVC